MQCFIARIHLFNVLEPGERVRVVAETPTGLCNMDPFQKSQARARHEKVDGRIKNFTILKQTFRVCNYYSNCNANR
jgi:hypothetical protein